MRTSNLVKVDILLNATVVDALSLLIHVDNASYIGKNVWKTKRINPSAVWYPIQAAIGVKVPWKSSIKDVTAKCYGGDISVNIKQKRKENAWDKLKCRDSTRGFMAVLKLKWFFKTERIKTKPDDVKPSGFFVCENLCFTKETLHQSILLKETNRKFIF
jgi:hypothetical protein